MSCARLASWFVPALLVTAAAAPCAPQELPPPEAMALAAGDGVPAATCPVQFPAGYATAQFRPVVVLLVPAAAAGSGEQPAPPGALAQALAARGFVVALPTLPLAGLARVPAALRRRCRVDQGAMHLLASGSACAAACELAAAAPWEFQTVSLFAPEVAPPPAVLAALPGRRCHVFGGSTPPAAAPGGSAARAAWTVHPAPAAAALTATVVAQAGALHDERASSGAAHDVAYTLDVFHDAADKGDAERYFARFPEDAVFLGTDGGERWDGRQFRDFALPYFRRGSAWTFVPIARHVELGAGGNFAWCHEQLDSAAYGECRGSSVLERRDGRWVVRQYDLSIAIPNDLADGVVARIRQAQRGGGLAATTVVIVRHAEREPGDDPDLNAAGRARAERLAAMLADLPLTAVFATEYRRTQATVAPLCGKRGLQAQVVPAADTRALARRLRGVGAGNVLVAGHSNTIGPLLRALGCTDDVAIADDDYSELFVVTMQNGNTHLVRLRCP